VIWLGDFSGLKDPKVIFFLQKAIFVAGESSNPEKLMKSLSMSPKRHYHNKISETKM
jgi:hypothetical protein